MPVSAGRIPRVSLPMTDQAPEDRALAALHEQHGYPAMSHPSADPALMVVSACLAGLTPVHPSRANVLEIGCASGHHLIPLALRWPEAWFTGIDRSPRLIAAAREAAAVAGVGNIAFHVADLREWRDPDEPYDCIIAHGLHSWVPVPTRQALLRTIRHHLASDGVAAISCNVEAGWRERLPVIAEVRRRMEAIGTPLMETLAALRDELAASPSDAARAVVEDMLLKGPAILPFDDFAPILHPVSLPVLVSELEAADLAFLGDADPAESIPSCLDEAAREALLPLAHDPLALQAAADEAARRTFRTALVARRDAPRSPVPTSFWLDVALRPSPHCPDPGEGPFSELLQRLRDHAPSAVVLQELVNDLPRREWPALTRAVHAAVHRGWLRPRIEPLWIHDRAPMRPALDPFRLHCARHRLPLVDAWQVPCSFPDPHWALVELLDGTRAIPTLQAAAAGLCPDLDFDPWLAHLAARGLFR